MEFSCADHLKPLSASQVPTYHEREFASDRQNYWSRDQQGHGEWQGKLAEQWGLSGPVGNEHFARLTEGQHPHTEAQLVRHQASKTYEVKFGREVTSVEHRAGWDATFSAPKNVSLTALIGGDERVREAHRESASPIDGDAAPQLHTHAVIFNVTEPDNGQTRALQPQESHRTRHGLGA
ncbi:relaxase domain-containing protein [Pseudacidobacterium ailaaui]|uniref:relaxase domain-containing protein n=1 Tax=Pseudacidobacterium ailaaui TaxID=1382359 RepID=UPI0009E0ABBB